VPLETEESPKERHEREHGELLHELRALIPGAEVLFGFLLAVRFSSQFRQLSRGQEYVYFLTLLASALAIVLFLAPAVYHRTRFRHGEKAAMLATGNIEAIVGSVMTLVAFTGVVFLVTDLVVSRAAAIVVGATFAALGAWLWWGVPLLRIRSERS
jgi:Family of unknown function (DUF6328)